MLSKKKLGSSISYNNEHLMEIINGCQNFNFFIDNLKNYLKDEEDLALQIKNSALEMRELAEFQKFILEVTNKHRNLSVISKLDRGNVIDLFIRKVIISYHKYEFSEILSLFNCFVN